MLPTVAAAIDRLERGEPLTEDDKAALSMAARRWEPTASEIRGERDTRIRQYRDAYYSDLPVRTTARRIIDDLTRYQAGEWRHHKDHLTPSVKIAGTRRELLFLIMKAGPLIDYESMRKIIG